MKCVITVVPYDASERDTEACHFCLIYMCSENRKIVSHWCGLEGAWSGLIYPWPGKNKVCMGRAFLQCGFGNVFHSLSDCH